MLTLKRIVLSLLIQSYTKWFDFNFRKVAANWKNVEKNCYRFHPIISASKGWIIGYANFGEWNASTWKMCKK